MNLSMEDRATAVIGPLVSGDLITDRKGVRIVSADSCEMSINHRRVVREGLARLLSVGFQSKETNRPRFSTPS